MAAIEIGFIGLGEMGRPMAKNLIKAGFQLTVYDMRKEPMEELEKLGAKPAGSAKEVAAASEVIISMVRDTPSTEQVVFGKDGLWEGIREGSTIIITSTIDATYCQRIAVRAKEKGVHVLDAPVSGGKPGAEAGTLSIIVGGEKDVFERCLTIFNAMGRNFYYQGGIGMGEVTKIANNLILLVTIAVVSEAIALAVKSGIEQERFLEILKTSSGNSWTVQNWDSISANKKNYREGRGGAIEIAYKDLHLALNLADSLGIRVPLAALASQLDLGQ